MKTVLVTGVGKGIGRSLAHVFLENGHFVIGTSTKGFVDYEHENLSIIQLDLSSAKSIQECIAALLKMEAKIDILINNAGVLLDEDDIRLIPEKLRATLEVNLIGTSDFTECVIPIIAPHGHIIFISSTAGSLERAGKLQSHFPMHYPAYKISKAAINMYMRTLAKRIDADGITVSSVHPGWVKTDMGGPEADITPEEAAQNIYEFALSSPETGYFWFKGEKHPW